MTLTVPKLTKLHIAMLEKCEAATRFTTTTTHIPEVYRHRLLGSLEEAGLVEWANGWRITDAGRAALKDEACKACAVRASRGFEGQCPACASERTRNERAALKDGAK